MSPHNRPRGIAAAALLSSARQRKISNPASARPLPPPAPPPPLPLPTITLPPPLGYYQSQVSTILTSAVNALWSNPSRRFIWAESSFLMRWFEVQSPSMQSRWRALVKSGRIELVGGGWVQNDEANPDALAVLAQLTEGHEYLASLFGVRPRFLWQIDPFGHSAVTPALAGAAGIEAVVINRVDYTVKDALKSRGALEFWWQPYASHPGANETAAPGVYAGAAARVFTHVLHTHYSAPRGFDFENGEGYPVGADAAGRAEQLMREINARAPAYRTRHILVPFGDDFRFQRAEHQFSNMDKLVEAVAADPVRFNGATLRYSTLAEYFDAVFEELRDGERLAKTAPAGPGGPHHRPEALPIPNFGVEAPVARGAAAAAPRAAAPAPVSASAARAFVPLPVYAPARAADGAADFFPYADNGNSYWTGYYVSRPLLKAAIRRTTALLRGADALLALVRPNADVWGTGAGALLRAAASAGADAPSAVTSGLTAHIAAAPYASFSWLAAFQRVEQVRLDVSRRRSRLPVSCTCAHTEVTIRYCRDLVCGCFPSPPPPLLLSQTALCLHHDAITGTSREHAVNDYLNRMDSGAADLSLLIADLASLQLGGLSSRLAGGARAGVAPAPLTNAPHALPVRASFAQAAVRAVRRSDHAPAPLDN